MSTPNNLPTWDVFLQWPFSGRARSFLIRSDIRDVADLLAKDSHDLSKYRGVGKTLMMELRIALGRHGLALRGEQPMVADESEPMQTLLAKEEKLKAELRDVRQKITDLRAAGAVKRQQQSSLASQVIAKWLAIRDRQGVAVELGLDRATVNAIVSDYYREKFTNGTLSEYDIIDRWEEVRSYEVTNMCRYK